MCVLVIHFEGHFHFSVGSDIMGFSFCLKKQESLLLPVNVTAFHRKRTIKTKWN